MEKKKTNEEMISDINKRLDDILEEIKRHDREIDLLWETSHEHIEETD